jgi:hypothetical protein
MADYYRRDGYGGDNKGDGGRYSRDDEYRQRDRYSPPGRSRSRERYQDRSRDDYPYRDSDRSRDGRIDDRDRYRDGRIDDRDRYRDSRDRDDIRPSSREDRGERLNRSKSPVRQEVGDSELPAPREPKSDRHRGSYDDPYDAGKPNSQVIFRGLEKDVSETDVYDFFHLEQSLISIVATISLQPRRCS